MKDYDFTSYKYIGLSKDGHLLSVDGHEEDTFVFQAS